MAKLKLAASPTFKAKVSIPVPGGKPADVEFVFRGRTRDQFREFIESMGERKDAEVIMDCASGWDLDDPFGAETVELMTQNYLGSARAVIEKYIGELTAARLGN